MAFCKNCLKEMEDGAPFTGTFGICLKFILNFGTTLLFESKRCDTCHSYISTKWILIFLPIFPLASYRISENHNLQTNETTFEGKEIPLYWPHVWMIGGLYAFVFFCIWYGTL